MKALDVDPFDIETMRDFAALKVCMGDEVGALVLYRQILEEDSTDALAMSEEYRLQLIAGRNTDSEAQVSNDDKSDKEMSADVWHKPAPVNGCTGNSTIRDNDCQLADNEEAKTGRGEELRGADVERSARTEERTSQEDNIEHAPAQAFGISALDASKTGLGVLLEEWGDVWTQKRILTSTSAPAWMDKCLVKLDQTLTMAESFHAEGKKEEETLFRNAFASLLKLYYSMENLEQRDDVSKRLTHEQRGAPISSKSSTSTEQEHLPMQHPDTRVTGELAAWLTSRAEEVEAKLKNDLRKGKSINESVSTNFPFGRRFDGSGTKKALRLRDIDLPDSVRDAIRATKYHGGDKSWRADYGTRGGRVMVHRRVSMKESSGDRQGRSFTRRYIAGTQPACSPLPIPPAQTMD